ncbi:DUF1403 family protein [Pararhizobium sp. LjRoot238]|uniref:DUF1403 family protein n=1 Tax=Pararhizobium sp. LjRoot238 TaxID=3342293 RepID=UPI003F4F4445
MSKSDSQTAPPDRMPVVPAWAVPRGPVTSDADAAFLAGAALNALDTLVRMQPDWAGVWRQRLALKCAVSAVRLAGRSEDEAALRDVWVLRGSADDLGPAGRIFAAYKRLAARMATIDTKVLRELADLFAIRWGDELATIPAMIDDVNQAGRTAPFAAAAIVTELCTIRPDAEVLAWWLADWMLAQRLRWDRPVPLLMAQRASTAFRVETGRGRMRPGELGFERAVCLALAQASAEACRLAAEVARRADRLAAVAPKLRAKGAGEAIRLLLDEDAVSGALRTAKLSRWASRRLFERLIEFDAVRELSGRSTFRIYGL